MAMIDCPGCGMIHKYHTVGLTVLMEAAVAGELHTVGLRGRKNGHAVVAVTPRCLDDVVPAVQTLTRPKETVKVPGKRRPRATRKDPEDVVRSWGGASA
jgi:hypothetical protein